MFRSQAQSADPGGLPLSNSTLSTFFSPDLFALFTVSACISLILLSIGNPAIGQNSRSNVEDPRSTSTAAAPEEPSRPGARRNKRLHLESQPLKQIYEALLSFDTEKAFRYIPGLILARSKAGIKSDTDRHYLSRCYLLAGYAFSIDDNHQAALNAFRTACLLAPDDIISRRFLAGTLGNLLRFEEEGKVLSGLAVEGPHASMILSTIARSHLRKNQLASAQKFVDRASRVQSGIEDLKDNPAYLEILKAKLMVRQGLGRPAAIQYRRAAEATENDYVRQILTANACFLEQRLDANREHLEKAGELLPGDPIWQYKLGNYYIGQGDGKAALDKLLEAIWCRRCSTRAYESLIQFLLGEARFDDALKTLDRLEKLAPYSQMIAAKKGDVLSYMRKSEEALKAYRESIEIDPYLSRSYASIANMYLTFRIIANKNERRANFRKMRKVMGTCIDQTPEYWKPYFTFCTMLMRSGDMQAAEAKARQGLDKLDYPVDDLNVMAQYFAGRGRAVIGTNYYEAGKLKEAIEQAHLFNQMKFLPELPPYLTMIAMRPDRLELSEDRDLKDPLVHAALADMLLETNRIQESIDEYKKALELSPHDADLNGYYLNVLSKQGDWMETSKQNFIYASKIVNQTPGRVSRWFSQSGP